MNRPIRSYVLRQGRTTPAQKRALEELYPRYGIAFSEKIASARKLVLEIGSGMGETTVAIAKARPEVDFIAVEVHGPGVGSLLNAIEREKLSNLRVIRHDALDVLGHMIGDGTLAAIHLFFPDPWPKKRHHKRRLVQPEFAARRASSRSAASCTPPPTGPSTRNTWKRCSRASRCSSRPSPFSARPTTKFESRGRRLGIRCAIFCFVGEKKLKQLVEEALSTRCRHGSPVALQQTRPSARERRLD